MSRRLSPRRSVCEGDQGACRYDDASAEGVARSRGVEKAVVQEKRLRKASVEVGRVEKAVAQTKLSWEESAEAGDREGRC